jgi:hypothetical protein
MNLVSCTGEIYEELLFIGNDDSRKAGVRNENKGIRVSLGRLEIAFTFSCLGICIESNEHHKEDNAESGH